MDASKFKEKAASELVDAEHSHKTAAPEEVAQTKDEKKVFEHALETNT